METNSEAARSQESPRIKPVFHVLLLLGIVAIMCAVEIYQNGIKAPSLVAAIERGVGASLPSIAVGGIATIFSKSNKWRLFYIAAYAATALMVIGRLKQ